MTDGRNINIKYWTDYIDIICSPVSHNLHYCCCREIISDLSYIFESTSQWINLFVFFFLPFYGHFREGAAQEEGWPRQDEPTHPEVLQVLRVFITQFFFLPKVWCSCVSANILLYKSAPVGVKCFLCFLIFIVQVNMHLMERGNFPHTHTHTHTPHTHT